MKSEKGGEGDEIWERRMKSGKGEKGDEIWERGRDEIELLWKRSKLQ